jgi:hypothetical protein
MPNYLCQIHPCTLSTLFRTCFEQVCFTRHRIHPVAVLVNQDFGKTLPTFAGVFGFVLGFIYYCHDELCVIV